MSNEIKLTQESDNNQIKAYFNQILALKESGKEFPVDLDDVWGLVYSRRDKAVTSLKENFIEGVDFQVFHQKGKNLYGGRPVQKYILTTSCLEYFIARKVRFVFDVYRKVFHKAVEQKTALPDFNNPAEAARAWAEQYEQKQKLEAQAKLQQKEIQKAAPKVDYHDKVLQSQSTYNTNQIAKELGMSARTLNEKLHELGIQYKQNGVWLLYHRYQNRGLVKTKTFVFTDTEGNERTNMQTVWTEKGRKFIHEIISPAQNSNL